MKAIEKLSLMGCCISAVIPGFIVYAGDSQRFTASEQISEDKLQNGTWLVSEKLDGIRAVWTGSKLLTRKGNPIIAPPWFTEPLPDIRLEGELWAGRGKFGLIQKTVLDTRPDETGWNQIKFMLFELPGYGQDFRTVYQEMKRVAGRANVGHLDVIEQIPLGSVPELEQKLLEVEGKGGEGLILRNAGAKKRSLEKPVKIKRYQDSEGVVSGYKPGKGKLRGKTGALILMLENGELISVGSGLTDADRTNPPPLGARITFRYNGLTANGLPRFPRFVRKRVAD